MVIKEFLLSCFLKKIIFYYKNKNINKEGIQKKKKIKKK